MIYIYVFKFILFLFFLPLFLLFVNTNLIQSLKEVLYLISIKCSFIKAVLLKTQKD